MLMRAAGRGHVNCVRLLLGAGANKEAKDKQRFTALMCAAAGGHADCVQLLMDCGASKEVHAERGVTALMCAAGAGQTDCVRLLMDGGADMEKRAQNGWTALCFSSASGHTDCARFLINRGANMEVKGDHGSTALFLASEAGHADCVRLLIDRGADKQAKAKGGLTLLMMAAVEGSIDSVRLLLDGGVNKEIKGLRGETALDLALKFGKKGVAHLISSYSGDAFDGDMAQMDQKRRAAFMGRACYNCFKTQSKLQKCSLCKMAQYCTKECQQSNWPLHKTKCDRGGVSNRPAAASQRRADGISACFADSSVPHVQPHVNILASESAVKACHFCAKSQAHVADRLKICDRCRSVSYCSVECQRSDWSAHKKECAKPAKRVD